jgi:hypothetical protein
MKTKRGWNCMGHFSFWSADYGDLLGENANIVKKNKFY